MPINSQANHPIENLNRQANHPTNRQANHPIATPVNSKAVASQQKKENKLSKEILHGSKRSDAAVQDINTTFESYEKRLNYEVPNRGADAKAIAWMIDKGYSPAEIMAAYDKLKRQRFWKDKHLNMPSVKSQIGALLDGSSGYQDPDKYRNQSFNSSINPDKYIKGKYKHITQR